MTNNLYYILPQALTELQSNLADAKQGIDLSEFINARQPLQMLDGIAIIHVKGSLADNTPPIHQKLGGTDYRAIRQDIADAQAQGAKGILFIHNSGGGSVCGCQETAQLIQDLDLPTVAYSEGLNCSASYKLSVGTDYLVSSPSCQVGNVGTILCFMDSSKMLENIGIEIVAITNDQATLKDTLHKLPLTEGQAEFLQDEINEAGNVFINHVKSNRPNIDPIFEKAGWYRGQKALDLGFVDELGSLETALERLKELIQINQG